MILNYARASPRLHWLFVRTALVNLPRSTIQNIRDALGYLPMTAIKNQQALVINSVVAGLLVAQPVGAHAAVATPGSQIAVVISGSSVDPNEAAEGEGFLVTSTGGFSQLVPLPYGTVTVKFAAKIKGERVRVVPYLDGDETYSIKITGADRLPPAVDAKGNLGDQGCPVMAGNPINTATGNKYRRAVDLEPQGPYSLQFVRYYNSDDAIFDTSAYPGLISSQWRHTYSRFITNETASGDEVRVERPQGASLLFTRDAGGTYSSTQDPLGRLMKLASGGWRYVSADNVMEEYSPDVFGTSWDAPPFPNFQALSSITWPNGYRQTMRGGAAGVADSFGRQLTFGSAGSIGYLRLTQVTDSSGRTWQYQLGPIKGVGEDRVDFADTLNFVRFFDSPASLAAGTPTSVVEYRNGEEGYQSVRADWWPDLLTGIVDENQTRFASFYYDATGRAIVTKLGLDSNETAIDFQSDTASRVTTSSGTRINNFTVVGGVMRPSGVSRPAGSGCSASANSVVYTASGRPSVRDDFNGTRTCFAYTTLNQEAARIEGLAGTADCATSLSTASLPTGARKISTLWHPNWNLPIRVAEPKKLTTYVYNGLPDPTAGGAVASCAPPEALLPGGAPITVLCKVVEQATLDANGSQGVTPTLDSSVASRTTTMSYNALGLMLTSQDALGHSTQFAYFSDSTADHTVGDLKSVTNAAGHTTNFLKYDPMGRPLRRIEADGVQVDMTYTARGQLSALTSTPTGGGVAKTTGFVYDKAGLLRQVNLPDSTAIKFSYDEAHRLVSATDGAANTVSYLLDGDGNRIVEERRDSSGVLARRIDRVFDALNRLQKVSGADQ